MKDELSISRNFHYISSATIVLGLNIKERSPGCDRTCAFDNCRLARAAGINPRKIRLYDDEVDRPFACSDTKGPLIESHGGLQYTIAFVDQATRMSKTYYMRKKSKAPNFSERTSCMA